LKPFKRGMVLAMPVNSEGLWIRIYTDPHEYGSYFIGKREEVVRDLRQFEDYRITKSSGDIKTDIRRGMELGLCDDFGNVIPLEDEAPVSRVG